MLTTDHAQPVARAGAADYGIGQVGAGVVHEDKADKVHDLLGESRTVAAVGDGRIDSSALGLSDVRSAIDAARPVAMASAGVFPASDDPRLVAFNAQLLRRLDLRRQTLNMLTTLSNDRGLFARVDDLGAGR